MLEYYNNLLFQYKNNEHYNNLKQANIFFKNFIMEKILSRNIQMKNSQYSILYIEKEKKYITAILKYLIY